MRIRRRAFLGGATAVAPIILGVIPFGLIYGVSATGIGLTGAQAMAMSPVVFAGAAQLAFVELLGQGAPALVVLATALVINLRMAMYSAALAVHFAPWSAPWKRFAAYLITDQAFAVSLQRFEGPEPLDGEDRLGYYLGAALTLWLSWQTSSAVGIVVGAALPPDWSLDFAVPLTFLALLVPAVKDRYTAVAAVVGGSVAAAAYGIPMKLGTFTGIVAGIAAGFAAERSRR